MVADMLFDT